MLFGKKKKKYLWGVLRFYGKCLSLVPETVVRIVVLVSNTEVIKTLISVLSGCSNHICHISGPYFDDNLLLLSTTRDMYKIKNLKFYGIAL
jgi:hypothetical protein